MKQPYFSADDSVCFWLDSLEYSHFKGFGFLFGNMFNWETCSWKKLPGQNLTPLPLQVRMPDGSWADCPPVLGSQSFLWFSMKRAENWIELERLKSKHCLWWYWYWWWWRWTTKICPNILADFCSAKIYCCPTLPRLRPGAFTINAGDLIQVGKTSAVMASFVQV